MKLRTVLVELVVRFVVVASVVVVFHSAPSSARPLTPDEQQAWQRASDRLIECLQKKNCSPDEKRQAWEDSLRLRAPKSPSDQADWDAWQATRKAKSLDEAMRLFSEEQQNQARRHANLSFIFLSGTCDPATIYFTTYGNIGKNIICEKEILKFQRDYWLALQGDYQAQIHIADCFDAKGCAGVVRTIPVENCAWLLVALSSGSPDTSGTYVWDYREVLRKASFMGERRISRTSV